MLCFVKALELNPDDQVAKKTIARLQPIVAQRQEKMKDEMIGNALSHVRIPAISTHVVNRQQLLVHMPASAHATVAQRCVLAVTGTKGN